MCKIQVYLYYVHILLRTLGGASESNKILRKSYASVNGGQLNVSMLFLHNNNDKKKNSPLEPQIYDQIAFANLFCDIYMYIMYCILIYIQTQAFSQLMTNSTKHTWNKNKLMWTSPLTNYPRGFSKGTNQLIIFNQSYTRLSSLSLLITTCFGEFCQV